MPAQQIGVVPTLETLTIQVDHIASGTPLVGATVVVYDEKGNVKYKTTTPASGRVVAKFLSPPAFVKWQVDISFPSYKPIRLPLDDVWVVNNLVDVTLETAIQAGD